MKAIFKNLLVSLIFLMGGAALSFAQPTLKGKVTDADGLPLPGVAVLVSGTTNGTTAVTDYSTLPEGIWSGDVSVQFDATWTS